MPKVAKAAKTKAPVTSFFINALGDVRNFTDKTTGEIRAISNLLGYMKTGSDTLDHVSYCVLDQDIEIAKKMLAYASINNQKLIFEFGQFKLDSTKHDTWVELLGHVTAAKFVDKPNQSFSASILALASSI